MAGGTVDLWTNGQLTAPALLEVVSALTLDQRTVTATDILTQGAVAYYLSDGELVFRFVEVIFFALPPGGSQQFQPIPIVAAADSVVLLDPDAATHAFRVLVGIQ